MENSRKCEYCNVDVSRVSMQKHLRSKKHLEKEKPYEMIIPEWLFKEEQTAIENKIKKVCNPRTLKQIAKEHMKIYGIELAKKMNNF